MSRILFSALSARRGGGLTYIRNVAGAFPRGGAHRLSILSPQPIEGVPVRPEIEWLKAPSWTTRPIPRFLFGSIYFRLLWPHRHRFDAVYYAGGSFDVALPRRVRTVVAFRNMLPFDRDARRRYEPGWIRFRNWLLEFVQRRAFRRADLVIFISNYARRVIDTAVPHRRGHSVVIPHGVTRSNAPLDPAVAARLPERFVLYLSIIDAYKAQVELVEAWARLRRARPSTTEKLILAGPEYPPYAKRVREAIRRNRLKGEVILLGPIRHDQVFDLTERAALNLFLSSCENCPNILLELMRAGRPLLVSSRQPMPEFGGPGLEYVDPYAVEEVAAILTRLLDDPARLRQLGGAAERRSRAFSWDKAGTATWRAIESLVEDRFSQTSGRLETM